MAVFSTVAITSCGAAAAKAKRCQLACKAAINFCLGIYKKHGVGLAPTVGRLAALYVSEECLRKINQCSQLLNSPPTGLGQRH